MKVFSAALALLASSSAPVFAAESTKLRAQQDDTAARDLAAGGIQGSPNAPVDSPPTPFVTSIENSYDINLDTLTNFISRRLEVLRNDFTNPPDRTIRIDSVSSPIDNGGGANSGRCVITGDGEALQFVPQGNNRVGQEVVCTYIACTNEPGVSTRVCGASTRVLIRLIGDDPGRYPFDQLDGTYMGSTSATILGRVLFGGCAKNLAGCEQGGYFEKANPFSPSSPNDDVDCNTRCKPNTCDEVDITIAVVDPGIVEVTIGEDGVSKDGSACNGGGGPGFSIQYDCVDMTRGGGAATFMCTNLPFLGTTPDFTGGVLTVKATVSSGGRLNWQAWGFNPDSLDDPPMPGAPSTGELSSQAALLKTGNIMGMKTTGDDMMHFCHDHFLQLPSTPPPTRKPTKKPTRQPSKNPTKQPSPTPTASGFNCPSAGLVGCTAVDPSNPVDECPTVGQPCVNGNPGEFCCRDGCPRNYCTAKQAPARE